MTATTPDANAWMGFASNGTSGRAPVGIGADWCAPVEYDQYKRYKLPVPDGAPDELEPWTRVTTLANLIGGGGHGLETWSERELLRGVGLRPALRALLADGHDDKAVLDQVRDAAKEASGMNDAARWGTAVHAGIEAVLLGKRAEPSGDELAEQYGRDVLAGVTCLRVNGVRVRLVERILVHATMRYAGRCDYLAEVDLPATAFQPARTVLRVVDCKTGARILDQGQKTGGQLSGYANATHMYDPASRTYVPMPADIDRSVAYVLAVRDGRAQLHEVDLELGWIDMRLAYQQHRRAREGSPILPVGGPTVIEPPAMPVAPESQILDDLRAAVTARTDAAPLVEQAPPLAPYSMTVPAELSDAGVRLLASIDANMPSPEPVEQEKTATGRAKPKCSKCRQPGHRARTCSVPSGDVGTVAPGPDDDGVLLRRERPAPPASVEEIVASTLACICSAPTWSVPEWTPRPDVTVCGTCGWPSAATVEQLRGERVGLASIVEPTPVRDVAADLTARIQAIQSQQELAELWSAATADGTWDQTVHGPIAAARAQQVPPVPLPF